MASPLAMEPERLNKSIYENKVPLTNACTKIFTRISTRISVGRNFFNDKSMGRFARPKRKKGSGFGIAYSIDDKNMHRAARKEICSIEKCLLEAIRFYDYIKNKPPTTSAGGYKNYGTKLFCIHNFKVKSNIGVARNHPTGSSFSIGKFWRKND